MTRENIRRITSRPHSRQLLTEAWEEGRPNLVAAGASEPGDAEPRSKVKVHIQR